MVEKARPAKNCSQQMHLWKTYQEVAFRWGNTPLNTDPFAIITAWNPRSERADEQTNQTAQSALQDTLHSLELATRPIDAGDRTLSYIEPSIAVACSLAQARSLCLTFEQNAFYWIANGKLELHPVLMKGFMPKALGNFKSHLGRVDL